MTSILQMHLSGDLGTGGLCIARLCFLGKEDIDGRQSIGGRRGGGAGKRVSKMLASRSLKYWH